MGMFTGSVLAAKQQQNQPSNSKISQATAKLAGWLRARSSAGSCIHDTCGLSMLCLQRVPLMQRDSKNSRLDLSRVLASLSVTASREHPSDMGMLCLQRVLLMQRSSKNSRLGPQSFAGSFVSDRSEGQKSLASIASMMSEKVLHQTSA
jgi:hypothetical protein